MVGVAQNAQATNVTNAKSRFTLTARFVWNTQTNTASTITETTTKNAITVRSTDLWTQKPTLKGSFKMSEKKPYTVTMTGTYFVFAESADDANTIVSEALLRVCEIENGNVLDTEVHWAQATVLEGHYSTIDHDNVGMSDYDIQIALLQSITETEN